VELEFVYPVMYKRQKFECLIDGPIRFSKELLKLAPGITASLRVDDERFTAFYNDGRQKVSFTLGHGYIRLPEQPEESSSDLERAKYLSDREAYITNVRQFHEETKSLAREIFHHGINVSTDRHAIKEGLEQRPKATRYHIFFEDNKTMGIIASLLVMQTRPIVQGQVAGIRVLPKELIRKLSGFLNYRLLSLDGTKLVKVDSEGKQVVDLPPPVVVQANEEEEEEG
jgi:hypothetical protein